MTLSTTLAVKRYAGDGTTAIFPTAFKFLQNAHVQVVHRAADGVETPWVENTHYTLAGAGSDSGGTLTVVTSPADHTPAPGETLVLQRIVPLTQDVDYPEGGAFPAATHEGALDLAAMRDQQISEDVIRALHVPVSDAGATVTEIPSSLQRANKYLAFDAAAQPIAVDPATASGTSVLPTGATVARLLADWMADEVNVLAWGADPTGVADSTAAIQAAIEGAKAAGGSGVYLPAGTYLIASGPLRVYDTAASFRIRGDGERNTILRTPGTGVAFDSILLLEGAAYGTATVAAGAVSAGVLAWAGHYAAQPTITISDTGGGAGAAATADWDSATGRVTGITITAGGSGYAAATTRLEFSTPEDSHLALQVEVAHIGFETTGDTVSCVHIPRDSDQHGFEHCRFAGDGPVSLFRTFANFLKFMACSINAQAWHTTALDIMGNSIASHFAHGRIGGPGRGLRIRADYQGAADDRPQGITFDDFHIFNTGKWNLYATDSLFINFNGCWLEEANPKQDCAHVWQVDDTPAGNAYVDETANASGAGAADFLPFPAAEAAGDWCGFGFAIPFEQITVDYAGGTAGVGGAVAWEYWNGAAWAALTRGGAAVSPTNGDDTAGFTAAAADNLPVTWDAPADWAPLVVNGSASLYWARARVTTVYTANPALDEAHIHEGRERVKLGDEANQYNFSAGTYIGGDDPVRGVTIKATAGNVHSFSGCSFNYGIAGIVVECDGTNFLNELIVNATLFQNIVNSALDMDSIRNAVISGNVDRGSPRNGSWVTRGSHANKGRYAFGTNNWHSVAPAVFEGGAAYDWNGDTGIVGRSRTVTPFGSGVTAIACAHGLFTTPGFALCTPNTAEPGGDLGGVRSTTFNGTNVVARWLNSGTAGNMHVDAEV